MWPYHCDSVIFGDQKPITSIYPKTMRINFALDDDFEEIALLTSGHLFGQKSPLLPSISVRRNRMSQVWPPRVENGIKNVAVPLRFRDFR